MPDTDVDGADLVKYVVSTAPWLNSEDIPTECKFGVNLTLPTGLTYQDFTSNVAFGGMIEGTSICTTEVSITIPSTFSLPQVEKPERIEETDEGCVKPPHPDPQNNCWIWDADECKWECWN